MGNRISIVKRTKMLGQPADSRQKSGRIDKENEND